MVNYNYVLMWVILNDCMFYFLLMMNIKFIKFEDVFVVYKEFDVGFVYKYVIDLYGLVWY